MTQREINDVKSIPTRLCSQFNVYQNVDIPMFIQPLQYKYMECGLKSPVTVLM